MDIDLSLWFLEKILLFVKPCCIAPGFCTDFLLLLEVGQKNEIA